MSGLVYALPGAIASSKILPDAGLENFVSFFDLYGSWVLPVDRTATMVTPLKMQPLFPMPAFRPFTKTYEEICNDRAVEVLNNAEKLGITINVMYSG
ncbi:MAG: hypothetical protein JWM46_908, partial [Candidatus Kaiserbacteria bacterium]|nr:hypothetical protein [Candidatus Kaiserbacteria bacterium]